MWGHVNLSNNDISAPEGGAMEYSVGSSGPGGMFIEFDLLNNKPSAEPGKNVIIFSVAAWDTLKNLSLNANAKRAFGLDFS